MTTQYATQAIEAAINAGLGDAIPFGFLSKVITLAIVALMVIFVIAGCFQGSIKSACALVAVLLALLIARLFYPVLARSMARIPAVTEQLTYYADSDDMLGTFSVVRQEVSATSGEQLATLVKGMNLPFPLGERFTENVERQAFQSQGATTLGEYLSLTIVHHTLNLLSFVFLFLSSYVALYIIIHMLDSVLVFPVLTRFDAAAGGLIGLLRGVVFLQALFLLVPPVLYYLPLQEFSTIVDNAALSHFFLQKNWIIHGIRALIRL